MQKLLYVGAGGFLGCCLRYLVTLYAPKLFGTALPFGTLLVNVIGGFFIGLIMEISLDSDTISQNLRLFLTTGLLGGLTTFSTFSYESLSYFSQGRYLPGGANIVLNVGLSLLGVFLGRLLRQTLAAQ